MRQLSRTPLLAWFLDPFNPVDTNFYGPYGDEPIRYTLNYIDPATRAVAVTDVEVGAIKVGQSFASNPGRTTTIAPLGAGFSVRATASRAALWQDGYDYAGLSWFTPDILIDRGTLNATRGCHSCSVQSAGRYIVAIENYSSDGAAAINEQYFFQAVK